jgi:hypothetical protein
MRMIIAKLTNQSLPNLERNVHAMRFQNKLRPTLTMLTCVALVLNAKTPKAIQMKDRECHTSTLNNASG